MSNLLLRNGLAIALRQLDKNIFKVWKHIATAWSKIFNACCSCSFFLAKAPNSLVRDAFVNIFPII